MRITKKETKLMAFITTFVMMLSCLVVAPTESKAAGDAPKVSILGASLRLDATEGCQSMRIGVKVENASKAKACGINLDINGNKISIATDGDGTDVLKGDKIYEYNEKKDTILYTAVIKDIPKGSFTTTISAQGSATPIKEGEKVTSSTTKKSVNSIIKSLQTLRPNLELLDDGSLATVTEIASLDTTSVDSIKDHATNNAFYLFGLNWAAPGTYDGNIFEGTAKDATVEYNEDEKALKFTTDTKIGKGLSYKATDKLENLVCELEVKAEAGTKLSLVDFWSNNSKQTYTATGEWQTISQSTTIDAWNSCCLATTDDMGATYYVKSFRIIQYTPLTPDDIAMSLSKTALDLSQAVGFYGNEVSYDEETGILSNVNAMPGFVIPLDKEYPEGTTLSITVYFDADNTIRAWLANATNADGPISAVDSNITSGRAFSLTVNSDTAAQLSLKAPAGNSVNNIVVKKIEIMPVEESVEE